MKRIAFLVCGLVLVVANLAVVNTAEARRRNWSNNMIYMQPAVTVTTSPATVNNLVVPVSAVVVSFVDFLIAGLILLGLMIWFQFVPDWRLLTLPLFTVLAFSASLGAG